MGLRSSLVDLGGKFTDFTACEVRHNNIQVNVIPDKLIMYYKRLSMSPGDACTLLTIENANITFKNNARIYSSMTNEQLYKASVASGRKKYELD